MIPQARCGTRRRGRPDEAALMKGKRTRRVLDEARGVRAMIWIIAIMLFLTILGGALGVAMRNAAGALETELTGRATVQIAAGDPAQREAQAARVLSEVRKLPEVRAAAPVDRAQLAALLEPWLGDDAGDPVPAMIDLELASDDAAAVSRVREAVRRVAPDARVDAHEAWMAPVAQFLDVVVLIAAVLVLLMAAATAAVVVLAARAGLDAHRQTIDVMHMLGSTDVQIARLFQRRIARVAAVAVVALVGSRAAALGSGLLGGAVLGPAGWIALLMLPVAFVLLAALAARLAVVRALRNVL
jgi:cell division transport system permease protein